MQSFIHFKSCTMYYYKKKKKPGSSAENGLGKIKIYMFFLVHIR